MELTDTQLTLASVFIPPILSVIINPAWSSRVNSLLTLLACLVVTVGANLAHGDLSLHGIGRVLLTTFVAYRAFWHPTGLADTIERQ